MISNILANIDNYNSEMSISQVMRFFERFNMVFTKTMIQNYVRVGVIPTPVRGRYYVKSHLILLAMVYELKEIYSLPEIGDFFRIHEADGDESKLVSLYNEYFAIYNERYSLAQSDKMLTLMVSSVAMKKNVKNMMDNASL